MSSTSCLHLPDNTAVFICSRVRDGHPILHVSHDGDGDWQFLCGGEHADKEDDECLLSCLGCVLNRDPSLKELADMSPFRTATRDSPDVPWVIHDDMEDIVLANIEEHGWHAMMIPDDDEGPGFIYTIGLFRKYGHPELICVGLPSGVAHHALCNCARHIETGGKLLDGTDFRDAFEGARCTFRTMAKKHYREHLGYALWYYDGPDFPVVQMIWPDSGGRLPGEVGCAESTVRVQTPLWDE